MKTISYEDFLDKIHGCWYGKCLGGAAGAPVEGIKKMVEINDFTEIYNPDLPNDDLDLQLLWLDVLEEKGVQITSCDLADAWVKKCWYPFSEYGYFLKNYMRGIKPPYSGIINNDFFKEGMGCPIRSEIWGIISAGNPELAATYAYMDGCLDHADNAVFAEQFLAAVESMAFFESDIRTLVKEGMKLIPKDAKLYRCFSRILEESKTKDWQELRRMVLANYSHPDFSNAVQNLAFVLIALLCGDGDMRKTINIAVKCGYDTDCTAASAASVIGIIRGYESLGDLKALILDYFVCGIDVKRPTNSIRALAEDTLKIALRTPNDKLAVTDSPIAIQRPDTFYGFNQEYPTVTGIRAAMAQIKPRRWEIYGPYFDQLDQPINPDFPSPHEEGCNLPDLVCMVNSEVHLDKPYLTDFAEEKPICIIDAYEDKIPIDEHLTLQGQMCCYAKTNVVSPKNQKVWAIVGNTDGFRLWVNGKEVLSKDEIRIYTPYNNFTLIDLNQGDNEVVVKLLRRCEHMRFDIGFRIYDGGHWHRSKWCTDLQ